MKRLKERSNMDILGINDLLPWIVLALGGALVIGTVMAMVRPPKNRTAGDLERPPIARSVVMVIIGLIAAIWAIASLAS